MWQQTTVYFRKIQLKLQVEKKLPETYSKP